MAKSTKETVDSADAPEPAADAAPKVRLPDRAVYIGPTFVEEQQFFKYGTVFNNGIPDAWKKKAEADAHFRMLLVTPEKLGASLVERDRPATPLGMAMEKVAKSRSGKAKKG